MSLPEPAQKASPRALLATGVAGLVGAVALVPGRPGAGWLITGLAVAGCVAVAGIRPVRPLRVAWGAAALALLAVGTFRAAGWLYAYCVIGALATAALSLAGGRSVRGLALGLVAGPLAAFRALPWAARGVEALPRRRRPGSARLGLAGLVTVGLLVVFGTLFMSADAAFAHLVNSVTPRFDAPGIPQAVGSFLLVTPIALGVGYLAASRPRYDEVPAGQARPVRRWEWALPLVVLDLLFLAFVAVQATALFGGYTDGLDYARYARSGFFQLVVVTLLTLVVLGGAARVAPRVDPVDRLLLRLLLGGLAALTLVIVASAMVRLARYEDAYGFTRLRVLVGAVELWLGVVYLLILAAGTRLRAGWLPRAVTGTAVAGLLAVALLNPDRYIAERNVDRYQRTGDIDVLYLSTLSADAAPALDRLPDQLRRCALADIAADLPEDGWRTWNLGRDRARRVLAAGPRPDYGDCS
jgi:Domain of unknown function (DUF4173)